MRYHSSPTRQHLGIVILITIPMMLFAHVPSARADRTGIANLALDSARQRLDAANKDVEQARGQLELTVVAQRQAQQRLDDAQADADVLDNIARDPDVLAHATADVRTADRVVADRASALEGAQARLKVLAAPTTNPNITPAEVQVLQVRRMAAERDVAARTDELSKAVAARQQAQQRQQRVLQLSHQINAAQNIWEQNVSVARNEYDRTIQILNDAERRYSQTLDAQTRAQWGLDAAEQEVRVAISDARHEEDLKSQTQRDIDRLNPSLNGRDQLIRADDRIRPLEHELGKPFGADYINPTDQSLGAERERQQIQQSRDDALRRAEQVKDSSRAK